MNLCSGTNRRLHEEICHEGRNCPMCDEIDDLENKIRELEQTIDELEKERE